MDQEATTSTRRVDHAEVKTHPTEKAATAAKLAPQAEGATLARQQQRHMHRLRQWLWLLFILCTGSLASLPLVAVTPALSQVTTTPKQSAPQACTGSAKIEYARPQPTVLSTPPIWDKTGQDKQAFFTAQACAALFTMNYEAFDADHPVALTDVTAMLSPAARQRFFKGTSSTEPDHLLNSTWQTQARKRHLKQTIQVITAATLKSVNTHPGALSVQFEVQYKMTTTAAGKTTTQNKQLIIELTPLPGATVRASTTWQITDWTDAASTPRTGGKD